MQNLIQKLVGIGESLNSPDKKNKGGTLKGIFLPSFLKLIEIEQNTCLVEVSTPSGEHGLLYFHKGVLYDACFKNQKGEKAVYAILVLEDVKINFRNLLDRRFKKKIKNNLTTILKMGLRKKGTPSKGRGEEIILLTNRINKNKELIVMTDNESFPGMKDSSHKEYFDSKGLSQGNLQTLGIQKVLGKIKGIDGFMAVGVFSDNGEMVAEVNTSDIKLGEMGVIANDVLLKAQKVTELMYVGHGQVVHVEAPKAHIICRFLNESNDFTVTDSGRAHAHMVLVLNKENGNVALGKMKLESIIYDVAELF